MTYELINTVTTNTIASFANEDEAIVACVEFAKANHMAEALAVVAFDDAGLAVESHSAVELGAYA